MVLLLHEIILWVVVLGFVVRHLTRPLLTWWGWWDWKSRQRSVCVGFLYTMSSSFLWTSIQKWERTTSFNLYCELIGWSKAVKMAQELFNGMHLSLGCRRCRRHTSSICGAHSQPGSGSGQGPQSTPCIGWHTSSSSATLLGESVVLLDDLYCLVNENATEQGWNVKADQQFIFRDPYILPCFEKMLWVLHMGLTPPKGVRGRWWTWRDGRMVILCTIQ